MLKEWFVSKMCLDKSEKKLLFQHLSNYKKYILLPLVFNVEHRNTGSKIFSWSSKVKEIKIQLLRIAWK